MDGTQTKVPERAICGMVAHRSVFNASSIRRQYGFHFLGSVKFVEFTNRLLKDSSGAGQESNRPNNM